MPVKYPGKSDLKHQPLLLVLFVLRWAVIAFVSFTGYQSIPVFTWLFYPIALYYTRQSWWNLLFFFIFNLFGNALAILGSFNLDPTPGFASVGLLIGLAAAVNVLIVICFAVDRLAYLTNSSPLRVYTFPLLWTGVWNIFAWYSPLGDFFTYSQAGMLWSSFRQIASFGGRAMLDFFMAWFGTVIVETWFTTQDSQFHTQKADSDQILNKPVDNDYPGSETDIPNSKQSLRATTRLHLTPLAIFCFIFAILLGYGGGQSSIISGSFYQKSYPEYITGDVIRAGCVIGNTDGTGYSPADRQYWFDQSVQLAKDGAKLVLWSEETSQTFNSTDKQQFLDQASAIASNNTIYLAVSYINNIPDTIENLMTLFAPNGTILLTYSKAHPVVGVEDQPPGPNVLQYVDTPDLGRVGVGICFDYNFPSLIDQAGQNKVDLMLQASWTWGPLGTFHARGNSLRAIENGFTMLRCGSQGMSGVFTHTSDSPYQQQFATLSNQTLIFQVPRLSYVRTTYTVFRGAFGWICLALGLVILIYLIVSPILHKTMRSRSAAV